MKVFLDVETGGLDPQTHSLLTVGIHARTDSGVINQEIKIRHDKYEVTGAALRVNGIDLVEHDAAGLESHEAAKVIDNLLCTLKEMNGKRIVFTGQNIKFDIEFLKEFMYWHGFDLDDVCSRHAVDTIGIMQFLLDTGKLPAEVAKDGLSLEKVCRNLGLIETQTHTALEDAILVGKLYDYLAAL